MAHSPRDRRLLNAPRPTRGTPRGLADVAVLIDGPPVPARDAVAQATLAEALGASLDASLKSGLTGNALLVVLRHPDTPAQHLAAAHAARPALLRPEGHAPPTEAMPRTFTLLVQPGVQPHATTITRALAALHDQPQLAAVTGSTHRIDGGLETHVVPQALHGGATLIRTEALREAGGFSRLIPPGGAADLDLTCRLFRNGHRVQRFVDFILDRVAWPAADLQTSQRAHALRDALIVHERYLPKAHRRTLRRSTLAQARLAAVTPDALPHFVRALRDVRRWARWERKRGRSTLAAKPLEALLGWAELKHRVAAFVHEHGVRRVVLAGLHPHLPGFVHAARAAGLTLDAIADDTHLLPADPHLDGVPVLPLHRAIRPATEAVLITDLHPATTTNTAAAVAECFPGPILFAPEAANLPQIQANPQTSHRAA